MSKVIKFFKKFRCLEVSSKVTKTLHGTYSTKMKKNCVHTNTYKKISTVIYSENQRQHR